MAAVIRPRQDNAVVFHCRSMRCIMHSRKGEGLLVGVVLGCPPVVGCGYGKAPDRCAGSGLSCEVWVRRRATLPHPVGCSTIAVPGLSFRVRNGAGRLPWAVTAARLVVLLSMFPTRRAGWWLVWGPDGGRAACSYRDDVSSSVRVFDALPCDSRWSRVPHACAARWVAVGVVFDR